MWSDLIGGLYADAEFAPPVSDTEIDQIEGQLGQPVPNELRDLLRHTDGVQAEWGSGLVWPVQETIDQNIEFRRDAAFAEFAEREKGTIAVGKLADFAVLSDDVLIIAPSRLHRVTALLTVMGGRETWRAQSFNQ